MAKNLKEKLLISVDPGFSGEKITVGTSSVKRVYNTPFAIVDITGNEKNYTALGTTNDNIRYVKNGRTYLLGERARKALLNPSTNNNSEDTLEGSTDLKRFSTELFATAMEGFIAYALYKYAEDTNNEIYNISDLSGIDIKLGVALPHQYSETYADTMINILAKKHNLNIAVGQAEVTDINFAVTEESCYIASQTLAALCGEGMDDDGCSIDTFNLEENLPAVVIDGGYKTIGNVLVTEALSIDGSTEESDTNYAMLNVNRKVAAEMAKVGLSKYKENNVDELCAIGKPIECPGEGEFDILAAREAAIKETSSQFLDKLLKKYDDFNGVKLILLSGGTGKAYADNFISLLNEKGLKRAASRVRLTSNTFAGKKIDPVLAISCGLFKLMAAEYFD